MLINRSVVPSRGATTVLISTGQAYRRARDQTVTVRGTSAVRAPGAPCLDCRLGGAALAQLRLAAVSLPYLPLFYLIVRRLGRAFGRPEYGVTP